MAEQKKNKEKRTYVRVDLATQVKVHPVSREEFEHQKSMRLGGLSTNISTEGGGLDDDRFRYLTDRLDRMEEKLDRLLKKLDSDCGAEEAVFSGKAINISGAGVQLLLEEAFESGQLVQISLSVPGFSIGFLKAYGEIVRVNPLEDEEASLFETSIKFLVINEEEREKLIAFAFQQQRQMIRNGALAKNEMQVLPGDVG